MENYFFKVGELQYLPGGPSKDILSEARISCLGKFVPFESFDFSIFFFFCLSSFSIWLRDQPPCPQNSV